MASVFFAGVGPLPRLSTRAIPVALRDAIQAIFSDVPNGGVWLVGGTALAGFYAEHRRSDDMDLFVDSQQVFQATRLAVRALKSRGAVFSDEMTSAHYYHALVSFKNHEFTVDIVEDGNLHRIGRGIRHDDGVVAADLDTLFAMKVAALLSRCSEKDLFDLDWMMSYAKPHSIQDLIHLGAKVDAGLNVESLLVSLQGTTSREEACHFLLPNAPEKPSDVLRRIESLRKRLIKELRDYEKTEPLSPAAHALKQSMKDFKD